MTLLTANGSLANAYLNDFNASVASIRELSRGKFDDAINNADTIINNASTITSTDIDTCLERNFDFTRELVAQLHTTNPDVHFIHVSSMSVLSPNDDKVYDDILTMTPYAYSKYLAEIYCLKAGLEHSSIVRFSTLFYGDPQKDGLSKLISDAAINKKVTIYNDGAAIRNFLPIEVAAHYLNEITAAKTDGKTIYNLAAPKPTSFLEVVDILKKHLPDIDIENKSLNSTPPVLADFTPDSVDQLGRIDFSLEGYIVKYLQKIIS